VSASEGFDGNVVRRGDGGYETARLDSVWNGRVADRFPELIVRAGSEQDVVRAVELARDQDMKIGVCSGGHSWAGSHLRDGGMLLDLSRLTELSVDPDTRTAAVQPAVRGSELARTLREHDLFFPVGHCQGVAVGGYLLQGGFGWLSRIFGPACMSVEAIDVVTADGELLHADGLNHTDLLWAARGAGPGFFGVVTRFHLRLHEWPAVAMNSIYLYPGGLLEEIFTWAYEIGPSVARSVEMMLFLQRPGGTDRVIGVTGPVLAGSEEEARDALAILDTCPVLNRATAANPCMPADFADLVGASRMLFPDGNRFAVDNMWTGAPVAELVPGLREIAQTLPPEPSHCMWMNWGPSPPRPDMAYSVEDDIYIALYASWTDAGDDAAYAGWPGERMRGMEQLATGIQLADENLGARPARFVSDDNLRRLDELRGKYDPDGRFHSWMGRPGAST
jgi:FAD/FMN-containing dehydrogenase